MCLCYIIHQIIVCVIKSAIIIFYNCRKEAAYTEISSNVCIADQDIPKTEPTNKSTSSADQIRSSLQDHRSDINNPNTDCNERY